ncbi:MAG TPA: LytTR family DNA-binding domain-containing protein [Ideonella sp.]|jgi:two-component system LytT family response regulator|nr:LytTR family DNA-binding domain-containing protein [Burkholderiaceae bacterium]HEV8690942.1 LytTR family DNA-binding domain-containing protein [Ideonella sp.]
MTEPARVTALIVDDEPIARAGLRHLLAEFPWVECIGEAVNGPAALAAIESQRPELVFLDIQLPGLLGTEVMARLEHRPIIVFTTAYAEHAVTAFELGALDYLLKPFGEERLAAALQRVRAALGEPVAPALERFGEAWGPGPISRLFVRNGRAIVPLAVASVSRFEAVGDYVAIHAEGGVQLLHLSLNRLEARLDPERFVRIHRTHIVNLDHVKAFRRSEGGLVAEMRDGSALAVSRAKAQALRGVAR